MLSLRAHGWTRNLPKFNLVTGEKSENEFDESFRFVLPGYNLRPLEMSGAVGIQQLKKLPKLLEGRRTNAALFKSQLGSNPEVIIQKEIGSSSWFGFSIVLRPNCAIPRFELVKALESNGFECRPIVSGNFAKNDVLKYFDYSIHENLKNADYVDERGLFLGNHHYPIPNAIEALKQCLHNLTNKI